jgi:hypothetical protein
MSLTPFAEEPPVEAVDEEPKMPIVLRLLTGVCYEADLRTKQRRSKTWAKEEGGQIYDNDAPMTT